MPYEPTISSLRQHPIPGWFDDAKLGIFVHWGLYSVPGWAPTTGDYAHIIAKRGWAAWFERNPYAEWYWNSLQLADSPTQHYHVRTYGEQFGYDDFAPLFNQALEKWEPQAWAELFQMVGARYVVLTTKHHDGFLLWPSERAPRKKGYVAARDIVGELTGAVRSRGMHMGLYYSGGLDWAHHPAPIRDVADLFTTMPQDEDYADYATFHWRELIERYEPAVLWNDIGYPTKANLKRLFADYYNRHPTGVVNDRFLQSNLGTLLKHPIARRTFSRLVRMMMARSAASMPTVGHYDFRTPEYAVHPKVTRTKWEATRGLGFSFGFNRNEGAEQMLATDELIRLLVDIVSKNGNLLLNIGPTASGTIPELQKERLLGLATWLKVNGEAIFNTRPWVRAESHTTDSMALRFTCKANSLYAILLDQPKGDSVTIQSLRVHANANVQLLGRPEPLDWKQDGSNLTISLPGYLPTSPAYAFRFSPVHDGLRPLQPS